MIVISTFYEDMSNAMKSMSAPLAEVMDQLVELYAVYWTLERMGDLLQVSLMFWLMVSSVTDTGVPKSW